MKPMAAIALITAGRSRRSSSQHAVALPQPTQFSTPTWPTPEKSPYAIPISLGQFSILTPLSSSLPAHNLNPQPAQCSDSLPERDSLLSTIDMPSSHKLATASPKWKSSFLFGAQDASENYAKRGCSANSTGHSWVR